MFTAIRTDDYIDKFCIVSEIVVHMSEVVSPYVVITSGLINIDISTDVSLHQD